MEKLVWAQLDLSLGRSEWRSEKKSKVVALFPPKIEGHRRNSHEFRGKSPSIRGKSRQILKIHYRLDTAELERFGCVAIGIFFSERVFREISGRGGTLGRFGGGWECKLANWTGMREFVRWFDAFWMKAEHIYSRIYRRRISGEIVDVEWKWRDIAVDWRWVGGVAVDFIVIFTWLTFYARF